MGMHFCFCFKLVHYTIFVGIVPTTCIRPVAVISLVQPSQTILANEMNMHYATTAVLFLFSEKNLMFC